jgi:phosphate uptake regulator
MASISSLREALAEVENIKALTEQAKTVPGLAEGEIENLYNRINRILNSYSEMSRKQYRAFRRELDELAELIADLYKDEKLSKKHVKIFDKTLNKLKIRDFYSARRLLRKFDDYIALNEDLNNSKEEYRRYYQ